MKKLFFAGIAVLCLFAFSAFAQKAPNFSGTWTLDVSKSKLGDRNNIESQTLTVSQNGNDLKVDTATKRTAPPAGAPGGGGGGRMGGGMGGDGTATYSLDGKEVKTDMQSQMGTMTMTTTAKVDGGKLVITRSFNTPNGARTTTDTWELSGDSKTLTVTTQRPNRDGGTDTTTKVYTKS
ncbi:MAG TPA: hypothetical protein VEV84_06285 [Pyrinomonadaceae bacterium]|jgi:hypothetical protein|nr:hypothetical protein [Pyrinomonadaceae bacterium]